MKQIGLYIHIPFCVRKCQYCDFLSFSSTEEERERYVDHLCMEMKMVAKRFPEEHNIDTVFIGGGTPSILSIKQLERVFENLRSQFEIVHTAEITLECNPGTVTMNALNCYRSLGINRLSFGVQSLQNRELQALGRIHTREEAIASFRMAREAGFQNINLDLMSGIPAQTVESYEQTLEEICQLAPEHISAYSLIVEEGTPFYERYAKNPPVSEEIDRHMYERTREILVRYGYNRYEISNYAKRECESKHNLKYWSGMDYLGVGLGASSKIKNIRYKNEANMSMYYDQIEQGKSVMEVEEVLSKKDEMAEFFILGLRKMQGVTRQQFREMFSCEIEEQYGETLVKMQEMGLLQENNGQIALTEQGIDVSNFVFRHFL